MAQNEGKLNAEQDMDGEEDEDTQKDKFLTFRLGDEDYGIEIAYVTEIIGVQRITEVPDLPEFVRGVINLRGRVIPVIDVRARFGMDARKYDDRTCVVVVNLNGMDVGLVVDIVNEVITIPADRVSAPPKVHKGAGSRFVKGMGRVGDEVKILLDVNRLLFGQEMEELAGSRAAAPS